MLTKVELALVAATFGCAAALMSLPYVMLSYKTQEQFGDDYLYILPQHDVPSDRIGPDYICTSNLLYLDYDAFLLLAANLYFNVSRPGEIPIHAGVYSKGETFVWSFRKLRFTEVRKGGMASNIGAVCQRGDDPTFRY